MKKRGFTLVELLAVIAILAILVIIALPNVMKLFNRAKEQAFTTELKEIYKVAEQQWIADSMFNTEERVYVRTKSNACEHTLDMSGRSELEYYIKIDKGGKVVAYSATDGSYQYTYSGTGLKIEDISNVIQISKISNGNFLKITCNGSQIVKPAPTNPGDYLMNGSSGSATTNFLRTTIKKNQIEKITFTDSISGHTVNGTDCWDVSVGESGAVLAWSTDNDNNGLYELTIGANGDVYASTGLYLFHDLTNLTSFENMEKFNISQIDNMHMMFDGCKSLTTLDLSNFDTSNVTDMVQVFYGCSNLTTLDLSNFNTSKVTDMHGMFSGCKKLVTLNIGSFDTSGVSNMSFMFNDCNNLTTLDVSHFNTSKVTNMNGTFSGLNKIATLDLSNFDTSKVRSMRAMFDGSSGLTSLNLSSFNTSNVISMQYMFRNLKLTSLDLSNFNTAKVEDMSFMFSGCNNLTTLDLSNFNTVKVQDMNNMFNGCSSLTSLNVGNFNTSRVTNISFMFYDCSNLTTLDLSNFDTSKVTDMNSVFNNCSLLSNLNISNFNTQNVLYMNNMFNNNSSLTTLDLSAFNSSKVQYAKSMFLNCKKLRTIYVTESFDLSHLSQSNASDMFYNCSRIKGGNETAYISSSNIYARLDDPANGNPGYFTLKSN